MAQLAALEPPPVDEEEEEEDDDELEDDDSFVDDADEDDEPSFEAEPLEPAELSADDALLRLSFR
jgi:hypothetical protein